MQDQGDGSVTLTREELYEQVWTTPMARLGPRLGLSDVESTPGASAARPLRAHLLIADHPASSWLCSLLSACPMLPIHVLYETLLSWRALSKWLADRFEAIYLRRRLRAVMSVVVSAPFVQLGWLWRDLPDLKPWEEAWWSQRPIESVLVLLLAFGAGFVLLHCPVAVSKVRYNRRQNSARVIDEYISQLGLNHGMSGGTWTFKPMNQAFLIALDQELARQDPGALYISTRNGFFFHATIPSAAVQGALQGRPNGPAVLQAITDIARNASTRHDLLVAYPRDVHLIVPEYRDRYIRHDARERLLSLHLTDECLKELKERSIESLERIKKERSRAGRKTEIHRVPFLMNTRLMVSGHRAFLQVLPRSRFGVAEPIGTADATLRKPLEMRRYRALQHAVRLLAAGN